MSPSQPCLKARESLERIHSLKKDFDTAFETAVASGTREDFEKAQELKALLEAEVSNLTEQLAPMMEAERLLDLRHQYESQTSLLKKTGLVESRKETDPSGTEHEVLFMKGIDGNEYPIPSYQEIARRLVEKKELIETKTDQGFTKLLLVPFGMSLDQMIERLKAFLIANKDRIPNFNPDKPALDEAVPVLVNEKYHIADINGSLVYDPTSFEEPSHGGKIKAEILQESKESGNTTAGWRILLLQTNENGKGINRIPRSGKGAVRGTKFPRKDIEAGKSAREYLEDQFATRADSSSPYCGEFGMTPEEWILAFMTNFEETEILMDDCANLEDSISYLTGASFFPINVPTAYWYREWLLIYLNFDPCVIVDRLIGVRSVVRV